MVGYTDSFTHGDGGKEPAYLISAGEWGIYPMRTADVIKLLPERLVWQSVRVRHVLPHCRLKVSKEVGVKRAQLGPVTNKLADVSLRHALVCARLLVALVDSSDAGAAAACRHLHMP